jgi:hypothetical protein
MCLFKQMKINDDFFEPSKERDGGHKQLISNGGRFKSAFAERDKKQTMIGLRRISSKWFKNQFCPSIRLSRPRAQRGDSITDGRLKPDFVTDIWVRPMSSSATQRVANQ